MTTPESATDLAATADDAIHALNYATRKLPYPGDAYSTLGNLAAMTQKLPQTLDQIGQAVTALRAAGKLRHTGQGDLDSHLEAFALALEAATGNTRDLAANLDHAQQALSPIAYRDSAS